MCVYVCVCVCLFVCVFVCMCIYVSMCKKLLFFQLNGYRTRFIATVIIPETFKTTYILPLYVYFLCMCVFVCVCVCVCV